MGIGFSNTAFQFCGCTTSIRLVYCFLVMCAQVLIIDRTQFGCGLVMCWGVNIAGSSSAFRLFLTEDVRLGAVVTVTMAERMRG